MKKPPRGSSGKPITTRSGKVLKVNRSLGEKYNAMRQDKALRRVNRLRGLPKSRVKRILWRLQPKRLAEYWFSRDGGIMALKVVGIAIVAMFIITLGVFAYFRKDLKSITDVSGSSLGGSISYYDSSGQTLLWQDYNAVKRVPCIDSCKISPYLKEATVAVEDKGFYKNRGFDLKGIIRAAFVDIFHRGSTQGGSTITQQLVKLTQDFNQNRNIALKIKELILAVELERNYTKDQILTSYLNVAPYGGVDYGAETAAQDYFHTDASKLTLAQAAFLATIPKSPDVFSKYSSDFDQNLFIGRYDYVLDQMSSQGKITKAQATAAKKVDILSQVQPQQSLYAGIKAPYFVLAARDELYRRFTSGSAKIGGWKVITSLDMNLQNKAEQVIQANIRNITRNDADEEAAVLEDVKTGQIKALVGGTDFNNLDHGKLNYAHSVNISPGSSFKPYDYSTLIENNTNVGAGSVLYDSQGPLPGYPCTIKTSNKDTNCLHDFDFRYPGPETLRYALGGSRNVPAVKAMIQAVPNDTSEGRVTSINKVISTADKLMGNSDGYRCYKNGVDVNSAKKKDEAQCLQASAIGDGAYLHLDDHTNGVASLARMGNSIPYTYIASIQNASGKTFYSFKQPKGTQVIRPDSAYIVDDMAADPNATYLWGSYKWQHYNGWETSIKTGTTNDNYDGLMMAWNTQYALGTWVGYHTRNRALATEMEYLTTPIAKPLMEYALDSLHTKPVNYTEPPGIQHLPAYVIRTKVGTGGEGDVEPSTSTDIYPSWYKQRAVSSATVTIDKVSGKIATSCTPDLAKQQLGGNSAPNAFSIDQFYPPGHTATASSSATSGGGAPDDVHHCSDAAPTISITASDCNDSCTISATPFAGTHPLNDSNYSQFPGTVTIAVNGTTICTRTSISDGVPVQCDYSPTFSGSGTITATVTDSVLYSGSDSATVNFTQAAAKTAPSNFTATRGSGSHASFSWTGNNNGPYTVVDSGGNTICSSGSNSCSANNVSSGTYYVQDKDDNRSNSSSI